MDILEIRRRAKEAKSAQKKERPVSGAAESLVSSRDESPKLQSRFSSEMPAGYAAEFAEIDSEANDSSSVDSSSVDSSSVNSSSVNSSSVNSSSVDSSSVDSSTGALLTKTPVEDELESLSAVEPRFSSEFPAEYAAEFSDDSALPAAALDESRFSGGPTAGLVEAAENMEYAEVKPALAAASVLPSVDSALSGLESLGAASKPVETMRADSGRFSTAAPPFSDGLDSGASDSGASEPDIADALVLEAPEKKSSSTRSFRLAEIEAEKERRVALQLAELRAADPLGDFLVRYDEHEEERVEADTQLTSLQHRYLAFAIANEDYAVSILDVREIVTVPNITPIPRTPPFILGIFSKRGVVMPVMDLASILGLRTEKIASTKGQRVLVVGESERLCGLRVDSLRQTIQLTIDDIEPMPTGGDTKAALLLTGLGKVSDDSLFIMLDVGALLDHVQSMVWDTLGRKRGLK